MKVNIKIGRGRSEAKFKSGDFVRRLVSAISEEASLRAGDEVEDPRLSKVEHGGRHKHEAEKLIARDAARAVVRVLATNN